MIIILIASSSFGAVNLNLKSEVVENIPPDTSTVELEVHHQDFIVACFSIKDFKIKINYAREPQQKLSLTINHEFSEMLIQKENTEEGLFNYKFIFKKVKTKNEL